MKFPVTIRHRNQKAKIYAPAKNFPYYRIAYTAAGKRKMETFDTYSEAKAAAEKKVREIHKESAAAVLTASQARDALTALQTLETFRRATGRQVSLLSAVSQFVEAEGKVISHGRTVGEAVSGFLRTVVTVKRKDLKEAVSEFLQADTHRTKAADGQRPQLAPKYAYNRELQLNRFAEMFQNTAVCDLSKASLDMFINSLSRIEGKKKGDRRRVKSAKSRNHYRANVRQFLLWAVRKDYLSPTHRLMEADALRPERANTAAVELYTPAELAALLAKADDTLRPMIVIGGLAGLRTEELLRLDWADVWRVAGHIEVTKGKAKTRQRRLVEVCPALAAWLETFKDQTTGRLWEGKESRFQKSLTALCEAAKVTRKANGLRHGFCSYHFAEHSNENLTAAQAGNSPAMIHAHYKGLATKAEATAWFNVQPPKAAKNVIPFKSAASANP